MRHVCGYQTIINKYFQGVQYPKSYTPTLPPPDRGKKGIHALASYGLDSKAY
ncbi:hypothetical protein HYC85_005262 [Camellia sinensis]|uniref:Uncharacterized protein n=1 Tax=Camellia sinensis TaxID=4442 RepID=A0A7J7I062_CAMSI|nr:hypothetical protein HYC85_005262 [Camellia sinensis]